MKTRILIYGGTNLSPDLVQFVRRLTRDLLAFPDVLLLSGGFECYRNHRNRISVDQAVLTEAEARIDPEDFNERFETYVPKETLDRRSVKRFRKGKVHEFVGTAQARRFKLVNAADALVTVSGEGHTQIVLELALAVEKPAIPVAFTGGDSQKMWKRNRDEFIRITRLQPRLADRLEHRQKSAREIARMASQIAATIHDAAQKRCLVLMPFGAGHDGFYSQVLHPRIEAAGYIPHRIDKDDYAGNIPALFLAAIERARAVIIDLTGMNPNVMYELGQVHARGINPVLIFRRRLSSSPDWKKPFYLRHEKLTEKPDDAAGYKQIGTEVGKYLNALAKNVEVARRSAIA